MPRTTLALLLGALLLPSAALAQQPAEQAAFITRLGNDTLAVERFTRTGQRIEGDLVQRVPQTRLLHYVATVQDGRITRVEAAVRPIGADSTARPAMAFTMTLKGDSVIQEIRRGDSSRTLRIGVSGIPVPLMDLNSYALYEPYLARLGAGDSIEVSLMLPGNPRGNPSWLARRGGDSVSIGFFGLPAIALAGADGLIQRVDGGATTVKIQATRLPTADVMALARQFAARDRGGKAMGRLSPRDTVTAKVAGADLLVDYSRPSRRGRTIFGGVVPWGEVWRTGADAATQFSTSKDLMVGDSLVPAGKYTLWTLPRPEGTLLIVNRQTGQWGTDYDPSQDLVRIPLHRTLLADPVEHFTIAIPSAEEKARLEFSWDGTTYWVPVEVK